MKSLFEVAIEAAKPQRGDRRGFTLGCVAIREDGKWVMATNGAAEIPQPSSHAEARALRKAGRGATLIVARVKKDGSLGSALPCARCRSLIKSKGVVRVWYSNTLGRFSAYNPEEY